MPGSRDSAQIRPCRAHTRRPKLTTAAVAVTIVALTAGSAWFIMTKPPNFIREPSDADRRDRASVGDPWFIECTAEAGIHFRHVRGDSQRFWFPEIIAGGCGLFDYDDDGRLDVFLVQSGELDPNLPDSTRSALYRNQGNGKFEDVTEAAGIRHTNYGMGCAVGDIDNDGDLDLYITAVGGNTLYENLGDGTFKDVTERAGVRCGRWSTSAVFADYDGDGLLDLYVTNYVSWSPQNELHCRDSAGRREYCNPSNYNAPAMDALYHNLGGGRFEDVTQRSGIMLAFGSGLGVCHGDFNLDGRLDFYVANDGMPNQLWINQGGGRFEDEALLAGCALDSRGSAEAGMGVHAVDIDDDGNLDLFVTHLRGETNRLYLNAGGIFEDRTSASGLGASSLKYTGWGTGFHDFDHDGHLDVFIGNGSVTRPEQSWDEQDTYAEPESLYRGVGGGRFEPAFPAGGTTSPLLGSSRAVAFGDIDNDGDIDILICESNRSPRLLMNVAGERGNYVMFRIIDQHGRDAVGATLAVEASGVVRRRQVQSGYSFAAANDLRIHVGLGDAEKVDRVEINWPDGSKSDHGPFAAGRQHVIRRSDHAASADRTGALTSN